MTRTIPGHVDSTGKLLERLAIMSPEVITQKGRPVLDPPSDVLYITPSLARNFSCVAGCAACCLPFTLDFTFEEWDEVRHRTVSKQGQAPYPPHLFEERRIEVNGQSIPVMSYPQYEDDQCPFLQPIREGGAPGCAFYPKQDMQPMECAAAPQILMTTRGKGKSVLMKRPFGRGWAWKDKPQCEFEDVPMKKSDLDMDIDLTNEIHLLRRYQHWAEYLNIETVIPEAIEVLEDLPARLLDNDLRSVEIEMS